MTSLGDLTYAIVDNNRNDNSKEQHENDSHSGLPVPFNSQELNVTIDQTSRTVENESKLREEALEAMYAVVNKKRKNDEEDTPPLPSHTVGKLYTAVNKNLKVNAMGDEGKAPPIQLSRKIQKLRPKMKRLPHHYLHTRLKSCTQLL